MANLYANENFPRPTVDALRRLGHDVLAIQDTGQGGAAISDGEVLAFATANGRAVITLNRRHFVALHRRSPEHAGIIVCSVDADFEAQAFRIHQAITALPSLARELIRVNRPAT